MAAAEYELPTTPFSHVSGGRPPSFYDEDGGAAAAAAAAAAASQRSPRRGASVRSGSTHKAATLNGHSYAVFQKQIRLLARTCDVEFLESTVPSQGPKGAADKEMELLRRILRHIDERQGTGRPANGKQSISNGRHQHRSDEWQNGRGASHEYDRASNAGGASSASVSGASLGGADDDEIYSGIEQNLKAILRELKRCEASKSVIPSFKDRFRLLRTQRQQALKDFLKVIKQNIKMVENMMPEASQLGHNDLALWISYSSDSFEREITFFLNRGTRASEVDWDMLKLQASQIMADVKNKWELAAEARKAFESFALICVSKYMNQKRNQPELDMLSDAGQDSDSIHPADSAWRSFQSAHRAVSRGRSTTDGSASSLRSYQQRDRESQQGSEYAASHHSSSFRSPMTSRHNSTSTLRSSRSNPPDQYSMNVARWGGDRAATTDLISRIQALSSTGLTHIREED